MRWGSPLSFWKLRRVLLAAVVAACAALTLGSPAAAATEPDAVVLVSGFTTTTPFTAPQSQCQGSDPRGATWSYDGQRYAAAGYNVFTAPVTDGAGPVTPDPPLFFNCPAQLPASMTINSRGDIYANAQALASFIAYLHSTYGVSTVRFVGHSYGGLWTRGALRLAAEAFPTVHVLSITTLGTPHLGSFMADIAETIDPALCGNDLACKLIADLLIAFREAQFEPALSQLTAASLAQWNPRQGQSLDAIPLTALAGDAITLPGVSSPYVSPDDVLVGIDSAQAVGLDKAGVIPQLSCFSPFPDVHSDTFLPFFPNVKHSLLNDPGIVTDVEQTLAGNPPASSCPDPALLEPHTTPMLVSGSSGRELTVPLRAAAPPPVARLPRASTGDAIIFLTGTRLTCHGRQLNSIPFLNSLRLRVIPQPSCDGQLRVQPRGAAMLYLRHTADAVNLRIQARRIFLHLRGPGRGGRLVVAVKRGHHFLTQSLDRMESLRVAGRVRTVTLRVAVARGSGRWELAVVTIHL